MCIRDRDVDLRQIARGTAGFTGADLENLLNEAALLAGRSSESFITMKAVSYTHLDVYKRQPWTTANGCWSCSSSPSTSL